MTQSTGGLNSRSAKIEWSTNNSDWTDVSGSLNKVDFKGGDRKIGEAYTGGTDYPVVTVGKIEPTEADLTILYSEVTDESFRTFFNAKANATAGYLRVEPKGTGSSGNARWTSGIGYVKSCTPPPIDFEDGKPILVKATFRANRFTETLIT